MSDDLSPDNRTESLPHEQAEVRATRSPAELVIDEIRSTRLAWLLCEAGKLPIVYAADAKHLWCLFDKRIGSPPDIGEVKDEQQARMALRLMEDALTALLTGDDPKPSKPARPTVNLERRTVSLGDQTWDVKSVQALRWLKVLSDHPGEWIAGTALAGHDPDLDGARTDRLRKFLPEPVQSLIDSGTGKGSRLRAWHRKAVAHP
jgi:hypothetical protein